MGPQAAAPGHAKDDYKTSAWASCITKEQVLIADALSPFQLTLTQKRQNRRVLSESSYCLGKLCIHELQKKQVSWDFHKKLTCAPACCAALTQPSTIASVPVLLSALQSVTVINTAGPARQGSLFQCGRELNAEITMLEEPKGRHVLDPSMRTSRGRQTSCCRCTFISSPAAVKVWRAFISSHDTRTALSFSLQDGKSQPS